MSGFGERLVKVLPGFRAYRTIRFLATGTPFESPIFKGGSMKREALIPTVSALRDAFSVDQETAIAMFSLMNRMKNRKSAIMDTMNTLRNYLGAQRAGFPRVYMTPGGCCVFIMRRDYGPTIHFDGDNEVFEIIPIAEVFKRHPDFVPPAEDIETARRFDQRRRFK